jgi:hypothetical protein
MRPAVPVETNWPKSWRFISPELGLQRSGGSESKAAFVVFGFFHRKTISTMVDYATIDMFRCNTSSVFSLGLLKMSWYPVHGTPYLNNLMQLHLTCV